MRRQRPALAPFNKLAADEKGTITPFNYARRCCGRIPGKELRSAPLSGRMKYA